MKGCESDGEVSEAVRAVCSERAVSEWAKARRHGEAWDRFHNSRSLWLDWRGSAGLSLCCLSWTDRRNSHSLPSSRRSHTSTRPASFGLPSQQHGELAVPTGMESA